MRVKLPLLRGFFVRQDVAGVHGTGWVNRLVAFLNVLNDSVLVDHEGRAISIAAFFAENAVVLHDRTLGEVAEQGKRDAFFLCEFAISGNAVNANAENLCVSSFEFGDISLIRLHFSRSTTGERQHIKREHDVLLAFEVTQFVAHGAVVRADDGAW